MNALPRAGRGPREFLISPDAAPLLQEVARVLKQKAPRDRFDLFGPVFRLVRDPSAKEGDVTVRGLVDDEPRNIWVTLQGEDYRKAVEAHFKCRMFSAVGILRKEGRRYTLYEPRNVQIVDDDKL